jgi:RimJ/RimL family protein N-acetyltransferase
MVDLNPDPAVMTYIRGRPATPDETAAEWRQRLDHQCDVARGLGYWAGFEDGAFVGWWSASSFEGRREISGVGYRLRASGWGRGLATEGAHEMVRQAFSCLEVDRVVASTVASNAGSRRVLVTMATVAAIRSCRSHPPQVAGRPSPHGTRRTAPTPCPGWLR